MSVNCESLVVHSCNITFTPCYSLLDMPLAGAMCSAGALSNTTFYPGLAFNVCSTGKQLGTKSKAKNWWEIEQGLDWSW